jgi:Na+-translocating ferredoxin:NAD+ oxidoreductase RnfD subunit
MAGALGSSCGQFDSIYLSLLFGFAVPTPLRPTWTPIQGQLVALGLVQFVRAR